MVHESLPMAGAAGNAGGCGCGGAGHRGVSDNVEIRRAWHGLKAAVMHSEKTPEEVIEVLNSAAEQL